MTDRRQQALEYAMADDELVARYFTLTPREKESAHMIAKWATNKEVARAMGISPRTAEVHRASVFEKLGAPNVGTACVMIFRIEVRALVEGGLG